MLGKCADALEIFADAREHTDNQVVLHELDQFLTPYCKETVNTCQMLLDAGQKDGAKRLIELWGRLLPEICGFRSAMTWFASARRDLYRDGSRG